MYLLNLILLKRIANFFKIYLNLHRILKMFKNVLNVFLYLILSFYKLYLIYLFKYNNFILSLFLCILIFNN